ncbi:MAG TPA: class I SAM-dependent methyltransferase [Solirubrobacteraceae bacterium]|nr:class I SAM-dependent methyltransferase [Solirubrobacteraceae bacterium]
MNKVGARERAFWDEHVPDLEHCLRWYEAGPDPNTQAMLDAVEPLRGRRVLDFACGVGVTAAFLAQRGAIVTGIDISPASIERGRQLADRAGLSIELIAGELAIDTFPAQSFDAVIGHYALHHVDLTVVAPIINGILVPGGRGSFTETMGLNPLLSFSRRKLAGRAGVAGYGSEDERPLDRSDLRVLQMNIGKVDLTAGEMRFLRIFDRNVLRYRRPRVSALLATLDDLLLRFGLRFLSYHQVVKVTKPGPAVARG